MAKDLAVALEDRPGTLADVAEALGKAGVNIEGVCAFSTGAQSVAHILVEDAAGAKRALDQINARVQAERDVVVMDIQDRPGELGRAARRIAQAGVNITVIYLATRTRLVVAADDMNKLRAAAGRK